MADPLLWKAARRAGARPAFLASALLAFARRERLDDDALAAFLGCPPENLPALLLCRRPAPAAFARDVRQIAARFQAEPERLAEAIRRANALDALAEAASGDGVGFLAAARDRSEDEPEP